MSAAASASPWQQQNRLYQGRIQHRRHSPKKHAFSYASALPYLDLEALEAGGKLAWFFGNQRFNWISYRRSDHIGGSDEPLSQTIRAEIANAGLAVPEGRIFMLANLAYLGHCFNPISLFFCHDPQERLQTIVAEVNNTPWGERICYVFDATEARDSSNPNRYRFSNPKQMHVSPFMPMAMEYRWRIRHDQDQLTVHIENWGDNAQGQTQKTFDATLSLAPQPLSNGLWLRQLLRFPFTSVKILFDIHWQAFRLWRKGVPYIPHTPINAVPAGANSPQHDGNKQS